MSKKVEIKDTREKYDFKDDVESIFSTGQGLNEEIVRAISKAKNEPDWMLEFRLRSYKIFEKFSFPNFGPDVSHLDFNSYTYFTRYVKGEKESWENVPETIKNTFQNL